MRVGERVAAVGSLRRKAGEAGGIRPKSMASFKVGMSASGGHSVASATILSNADERAACGQSTVEPRTRAGSTSAGGSERCFSALPPRGLRHLRSSPRSWAARALYSSCLTPGPGAHRKGVL